ncbi:uncharacterized protein LOC119301587 [Triticum dicoccoides]|uniref:uncharacterized protein LOC119301587 n=1 Tax=Triticum dicoccoides TaxID=85692 RepID=UPI00188F90B4|nr:uncharacterized protein LOC119301587 [Triticum dicoccoides]
MPSRDAIAAGRTSLPSPPCSRVGGIEHPQHTVMSLHGRRRYRSMLPVAADIDREFPCPTTRHGRRAERRGAVENLADGRRVRAQAPTGHLVTPGKKLDPAIGRKICDATRPRRESREMMTILLLH